MEVIINFFGSLIKIAVLSSVYALLTLCLLKLIGYLRPNSWFDRVSRKKFKLWFFSGLIFSIGLTFFLFTYWGFHGFGDGPRIPIGRGVIVDNTNWDEYGYIQIAKTSDSIKIEMTKFTVVNDKLVGNLQSGFYDYKNEFFVYDLDKKLLTEFKTLNDYEFFASQNNLPSSKEFRTFRQNYLDYWGGFRFWFLG